jgi:hypothetical protein
MVFERHLVKEEHVRRFLVTRDQNGWDAREEEDSVVIRALHHDDWHRVERAMREFEDTASELEKEGWLELRAPSH